MMNRDFDDAAPDLPPSHWRLSSLVASMADRVDPWVVLAPRQHLEQGEWGLAFETLCDNLAEDEVPLFDGELVEIEALGSYLAEVSPFTDRGVWRELREQRWTG